MSPFELRQKYLTMLQKHQSDLLGLLTVAYSAYTEAPEETKEAMLTVWQAISAQYNGLNQLTVEENHGGTCNVAPTTQQ